MVRPAFGREDVAQILGGLHVEFTFVGASIEFVLPETSQDFFDVLPVIGRVVRVDEDNVIDETLKGCRSVGKSKWHDMPFKRSVAGPECSLPFISGSDAD
ncbi:hypothetical protein K466DRAFT_501652 [Polyporus arcularius HHB13444]|uniref:Uncharacterized protein n=1 Tax=Polyporus arcularius HHB13444 TaxID=1314778 RepID=A0A5C3NZE3_9APHY|nr:hypothetical protein K466DRAFT_501652 [Polyporus arcularius HHB13444]